MEEDYGIERKENITDNLKELVKMAWGVSENIQKMEDEVRKCFIRLSVTVLLLYICIMVAFIPVDGFETTSFIGGVFFGKGFAFIKSIGLLFLCTPLVAYVLLSIMRILKMKNDIESEQDVLNQLLAVTFDIRRSVSYIQQRKYILEFITIDLDLKRLKFAASKGRKKNESNR